MTSVVLSPLAPQVSLLMLAYNFPPASTAGVHRSLRFAKYLGDFGCGVSVLTRNCAPDPGGESLLAQLPNRVTVHRVGTSTAEAAKDGGADNAPASKSGTNILRSSRPALSRWVKDLLRPGWEFFTETPDQHVDWSRRAAAEGIRLCNSGRFDVLYTTGPPHSTHLAGQKIHRATGVPWIADFRDPWARRPWMKARNPLGQRLLPYYERKIATQATLVLLNNEASRVDFQKAYPSLPPEKFITLTNGFDPELLDLVAQVRERIAREPTTKPISTPVLCHPGSLYGERDPGPILEAIASLRSEGLSVRFQQIGSTAPYFDIAATAAALGIQELVESRPPVPHHEAIAAMARADILLIVQPNAPLMVPGKVFEMLIMRKPILAVCDSPATAEIIIESGGICAASASASEIAAGIKLALQAAADQGVQVKRAAACEKYNGRNQAGRLAQIIQQAARRPAE